MEEKNNIFGCFIKSGFDPELKEQDYMYIGPIFRPYIWGEKGISPFLKKLVNTKYGNDLELALFEFYVKPTKDELSYLKEIGRYRKKEKSIGIPIIVTDENFFSKSEEERYAFLKETILGKMVFLEALVKRRKLDTNMDLLKADLQKILINYKPN